MTASIRFIVEGLTDTPANRSRHDVVGGGIGHMVTIVNVSPGSVNNLEVLWYPKGDTGIHELNPYGDTGWYFYPTAGVYGSYLFKLTVDGESIIRECAILTPNRGLRIPALGEKASVDASYVKRNDAAVIAASHNNVVVQGDDRIPSTNYTGYTLDLEKLILVVDQLAGVVDDIPTDVQAQLTAMLGTVNSFSSSITSLHQDHNAQQTTLGQHASRLGTVEGKVATLEAQAPGGSSDPSNGNALSLMGKPFDDSLADPTPQVFLYFDGTQWTQSYGPEVAPPSQASIVQASGVMTDLYPSPDMGNAVLILQSLNTDGAVSATGLPIPDSDRFGPNPVTRIFNGGNIAITLLADAVTDSGLFAGFKKQGGGNFVLQPGKWVTAFFNRGDQVDMFGVGATGDSANERWWLLPEAAAEQVQVEGSGGWQTYCDFNFTQLPNQTLADGPVEVDGVPMVCGNIASSVSSAQIINGSGLRFTANSQNSFWYYTAHSAAYFAADLPVHVPGWRVNESEVRISAEVELTVGTANYATASWGLSKHPFVLNNDWVHMQRQVYAGGISRSVHQLLVGQEFYKDFNNSYKIGQILMKGIYDVSHFVKAWSGADSDSNDVAFDADSFELTAVAGFPAVGAGIVTPPITNTDHLLAFICGQNGNAQGNTVCTFKRLRIEYKL